MAKNEVDKRPGDSKGFHKGQKPEKFGPNDDPKAPSSKNNTIGATKEDPTSKPGVTESVLDYPDKEKNELNAESYPNKKKDNVNWKVLDYQGDTGVVPNVYSSSVPVGGTPKPNTIS